MGHNARDISLETLYVDQFIINSIDKTQLSCYTTPPTQHHSFFGSFSPLKLASRIEQRGPFLDNSVRFLKNWWTILDSSWPISDTSVQF